jgi:hypothetical protein
LDQWKEGVPLTLTATEGLDHRWQPDDIKEFLNLLPRFRKDTQFDEFFKAHADLFKLTTDRAGEMLGEAHLEWFARFFGARPGARFHVVLSLTNGPCNYGPNVRLGEKEDLYAVLGIWEGDWLGRPKFPGAQAGTLIHEFGHSYMNPIVYRHIEELKAAGERIFPHVKGAMEAQAYGDWQTMMIESLNRAAAEVRYTRAIKGPEAAKKIIQNNVARGFLWTGELADLLGQYEAHRDQYPTLDAFFPRIVDFFNEYSQKMKKARAGAPQVIKTIPAAGERNVDPALKELVVVFDREMKTNSYAWTGDGKNFPRQAKGAKPIWRDARTCTLAVQLEPGRSYFFGINGGGFSKKGFLGLDGTPAEAVVVPFTTRAANK